MYIKSATEEQIIHYRARYTYFLGRYTAISGEAPGARLVRLPGPRGWVLIVLVILELAAAPPLWAAIARPSGELIGYLLYGGNLGNSPRVIAILFIVAALAMSLPTSYRMLERQQLIICGVLVLGTILGTIMVQPDLALALRGLLSFGHIPEVPDSAPAEFRQNPLPLLAVTFGYIGGSVMTYLVYPDFIALHGWGMTGHPEANEIRRRAAAGMPGDYLPSDPAAVAEIRRGVAPIRWDVACGGAVLLIVTASFMMSGASAFFDRRQAGEAVGDFNGWHLLTDQAHIWQSIHPALVWVYYVCVLAALWGTLQSYPDVYARCVTEYARAIWPARQWNQRRIQTLICVYVFATASAVVWSEMPFNSMTLIVNFFATTLGVVIAMAAGLYLNFKLPRPYRTATPILVAGVFSILVLLIVVLISGHTLWQQLAAP